MGDEKFIASKFYKALLLYFGDLKMPRSKKDLEKLYKVQRAELAALEVKCQGGSGTKEDYIELAKMRKRYNG